MTSLPPGIADEFEERRAAFRRLHEAGCFVLPNPWDVGTALYLRHLGFKALATTSSGAAFSMGLPDSDRAVSRDTMLAHVAMIATASDLLDMSGGPLEGGVAVVDGRGIAVLRREPVAHEDDGARRALGELAGHGLELVDRADDPAA